MTFLAAADVVCVVQLSSRMVEMGNRQAERVQWAAHEVTPSSHFLEYIPGRDQLWTPEALRAGSSPSMLCCAVLCCAVLCCAVLCCAVPCCAVLCRAVLCCAVCCRLHRRQFWSAAHYMVS